MFAVLPKARPSRPDLVKIDRQGTPTPRANVLKEGFLTPIPSVPEDAASVRQQSRVYFYSLCPRNDFHAWLVEDTALCTLRPDHIARIERRERDRIALRAEHFWDEDRRGEAEAAGTRLATSPAATVRALERTPQGCDWLIGRWAMLARAADLQGGAWDEAQSGLAFDLMGTPQELRRGTPGQAIDEQGRAIGEAGADPATIARGQVDRLMGVRDSVGDADALDRALAMADMTDAASPELRRLRRYAATLHKRMRWNLHQLQQEPKWARPHPDLLYLYPEDEPAPEPEPEPEPVAEATRPSPGPEAAEPEPELEAPPVIAPTFPIPRSSRPDPARLLKAARRRAGRKDVEHDRD